MEFIDRHIPKELWVTLIFTIKLSLQNMHGFGQAMIFITSFQGPWSPLVSLLVSLLHRWDYQIYVHRLLPFNKVKAYLSQQFEKCRLHLNCSDQKRCNDPNNCTLNLLFSKRQLYYNIISYLQFTTHGMNRQRLTGILKYDTIIFYIKVINEKWLKKQKFHIILYHLK